MSPHLILKAQAGSFGGPLFHTDCKSGSYPLGPLPDFYLYHALEPHWGNPLILGRLIFIHQTAQEVLQLLILCKSVYDPSGDSLEAVLF